MPESMSEYATWVFVGMSFACLILGILLGRASRDAEVDTLRRRIGGLLSSIRGYRNGTIPREMDTNGRPN